MVDFNLTEEQDSLIEQARAVARRAVAPNAQAHDRDGTFPANSLAALGDAGLTRLFIPTELGGADADLITYALTVAEIAQACGSTGLIFAMHSGATRLLSASSAERARQVLRTVVDEGRLIAWGFSEPEIGGNVLAPQLLADYDASSDIVSVKGRKAFCTGAGQVDYYLINAHSGEADFRRSQSMLLLEADTDGMSVLPSWDGMGMRGNCAHNLNLDCKLAGASLIGGSGAGMPLLGHSVPALVLGLAATSLGIARAAAAFATEHVTRRRHTHTQSALADYQGVRFDIAEITVGLHTAYLTLLHAAHVAQTDALEGLSAINIAKYVCNTTAIDIADKAMQLTGGAGYLRANPLERHYRDARAGAVMGANLGLLKDMIGKTALGMDPRA